MTAAFFVRPAVDSDLVDVKACLAETWHATYDAIFGRETVAAISSRWHAIDALRAELRRAQEFPDSSTFLVGVEASRIVGTASARLVSPGHVSLQRLYVLPMAQRSGYGKQLMDAALGRFAGLQRATLDVEPRNIRAIRFYQRHGFRQIALEEREHAGSTDMAAVFEKIFSQT